MKLGFWNRLALVVSVLGVVVGSTWLTLASMNDYSELIREGYLNCMAPPDLSAERREWCWNEYLGAQALGPGWGLWREMALSTAVIAVVAYLLLALAGWVGRWVWRGRGS